MSRVPDAPRKLISGATVLTLDRTLGDLKRGDVLIEGERIAGATVLTLDRTLGGLKRGDVLIEGERIAAVGPVIDARDAERIDGAGRIVMPGIVNAHMHTWQTSLRGVAGNWTILGYFRHMHAGLATRFGPEDIRISTLVGALNQINCGTTTLVDWCHTNPTSEHT